MELNAIEQYVINKMEALQQENIELKQRLAEKENAEKSGNLTANCVGKVYYHIHTGWVQNSNYQAILNAYNDKDLKRLKDSYNYYVDEYTWNVELKLYSRTYALRIDGKYCSVMSPFDDDSFPTKAEAEAELLKKVRKELEEYAEKNKLVLDFTEDIDPPTDTNKE